MSVLARTLGRMSDPAEINPVSYSPEEASNLAMAAASLAGFDVTDSVREMLGRLNRGELTEEEAIAEIKDRYAEPGFRD